MDDGPTREYAAQHAVGDGQRGHRTPPRTAGPDKPVEPTRSSRERCQRRTPSVPARRRPSASNVALEARCLQSGRPRTSPRRRRTSASRHSAIDSDLRLRSGLSVRAGHARWRRSPSCACLLPREQSCDDLSHHHTRRLISCLQGGFEIAGHLAQHVDGGEVLLAAQAGEHQPARRVDLLGHRRVRALTVGREREEITLSSMS
jgi:hypothetical protein